MKDLHNHILYGIDDGSVDLESSIKLLEEIKEENVEEIVLTPHYIIGSNYNAKNKIKKDILATLKDKTDINLYLGNEVTLDNDIIDYIKNKEISTINDSRYLLVEFPINEELECASVLLDNLLKSGIIPIIAHPERYHYYRLKDFETFINSGCLLQGNITSLINKYGTNSKKNLELLLKKDMIHLLGTDTHRNIYNIKEAQNILKKLVSNDRYIELTSTNFDKVINDEEIKTYEIVKLKGFNKYKDIK